MTERHVKYKVWMVIEQMYLDEDGIEQHRDIDSEVRKVGDFLTEEEAIAVMDRIESMNADLRLPDTPLDSH